MKNCVFLIVFGVAFATCLAEEKLIFTVNADTNIMTACNRTAQIVVVYDYLHTKCAIYNGTAGAAFIFDFDKNTGVYFPDGLSDATWYSSRHNFEDYFSNIAAQDTVYELGEKEAVTFDDSSITTELSEIIAKMLTPLSTEYSSPYNSFQHFMVLCRINSKHLHTSLDHLSAVTGTFSSEVRGDFKWMIQVFMGYAALFGEFKCGMTLLTDVGIKLDFHEVLNEPTGFDTLNYFLKELAPKLDIDHILGHALNSEQRFLQLINGLGGEMTYGFDGFVNIISKTEDYIHGDCHLQEVITDLNAYYNNSKTNSAYVRKELPRAIKDLLSTIEKFKLTEALKGLTKLLRDILGNRWAIGDNNMTIIVQGVLKIDPKGDMAAVADVVELLGKIKFVVSPLPLF